MTRHRLRPAHHPDDLARIYARPHDANNWTDHRIRVEQTIDFIRAELGHVTTAADLSCGNGAILDGIDADTRIKGDFAPGYPITGPLEETIALLPDVDLYVCSETLEHLDDPDAALRQIRAKARHICVSTPTLERHDSDNVEHYWSWGLDDIATMLLEAGFDQLRLRLLPLGYYTYQVWIAS